MLLLFQKEVYSDLTGERGTLMGCIQGIFAAQYEVLRKNGHSPSESFNETVEELTQSLGLFNDSYKYPESIYYQGWTTTTEYAPIDVELIEMLYNE